MKGKSSKILAICFLVLIYSIGMITMYNSRDIIKVGLSSLRENGGIRNGTEAAIQNNFAFRNGWINLNGLFYRCIGDTIVRDSEYIVYKLSNGQIMYNLDQRDIGKYAAYVDELDDALNEMGIDFMYVQIPFKIKDDSYMPPGTHTYPNRNAEQMVQLLREKGINTMNLRDNIEEAGLDWSELYYNTDHHWRETTAFWAAGEIMERLEEDYGIKYNKDYYLDDKWDKEYYNDYMLGTVGRRTGIYYAGLDDFVLFDPKFETSFSYKAYKKSLKKLTVEREGSFRDSMYEWDNLEKRADFTKNTYSTYTGKEYGVVHIDNKNIDNGPKILMIRESFTCALLPFISVNADEVLTVDLRRFNEKSVPELCEEFEPDVVIMDYNPSAFSKKQFDFFNRDW